MRKLLSLLLLMAGLAFAGGPSAIAAPIGSGFSGGSLIESYVEPVYDGGGYRCERLRRACVFKHERGEVGEGNCRRYQAECGGRGSYCERLRRACEFKYERGEIGQGNCRRYYSECGRH
jgi:hypothetical protein